MYLGTDALPLDSSLQAFIETLRNILERRPGVNKIKRHSEEPGAPLKGY